MSYGNTLKDKNRKLKIRLTEADERTERLHGDLMDAAKEAKRLNRRAKAGVCSKCHRTFKQLSRHMKSKHEDAE